MALSSEMQLLASSLLTQFGSTVTLKKPSASTYDIATGTTIVTPGTETVIKASIESYTSEEIKGLVQAGDIKIMIPSGTAVDIAKDTIVFNSNTYQIINVEPLYLQNEIVIYNIQVRK